MLNITNSIKLKFQKYDLHEFTSENVKGPHNAGL